MKIAMVGSPKVGKTSFLASLYNQLGRSSVRGFKLHGTRNTDVTLSRIWKNIITQEQWPEHNIQNNNYSFDLLYNEQILERVDINSISFSNPQLGGVGGSKDENIQDDIDGLFIFLDATNVFSNQHNGIPPLVANFLQDNQIKKDTTNVYTAIVITKCDVIKKEHLNNFNDFKELLFKNISDFSAPHQFKCDVFLVSSIGGKSTDLPASLIHNSPSTISLYFNLDTTNVTNPILFFLEWFMNNSLQKDEHRLSNHIDELVKLINSYSIKDDFINLILNRQKIYDQIIKKANQLTELRNSVNNQKMISEVLKQEIE